MPPLGEIHVDAALSGMSVAYKNTGFMADDVCPRIRVAKQSDIYYIYDATSMTPQDDARARLTESKGIEWGTSTSPYYCKERALHGEVADADYKNADTPIRPEVDTVETVTDVLMMNREIRVASLYTDANNFAAANKETLSGTAQWDDYTNSTPEVNMNKAKDAVHVASGGKEANTLILSFQTALVLATHPNVRDAKKNPSAQLLTSGLPDVLWGLKVRVASSLKNTADKGQTEVLTSIWSDFVCVAYIEPTPGLKNRSFGATFDFGGRIVRRMPEPKVKGTRFEVEEQGVDEKIISAGSGFLFTDVLSATPF